MPTELAQRPPEPGTGAHARLCLGLLAFLVTWWTFVHPLIARANSERLGYGETAPKLVLALGPLCLLGFGLGALVLPLRAVGQRVSDPFGPPGVDDMSLGQRRKHFLATLVLLEAPANAMSALAGSLPRTLGLWSIYLGVGFAGFLAGGIAQTAVPWARDLAKGRGEDTEDRTRSVATVNSGLYAGIAFAGFAGGILSAAHGADTVYWFGVVLVPFAWLVVAALPNTSSGGSAESLSKALKAGWAAIWHTEKAGPAAVSILSGWSFFSLWVVIPGVFDDVFDWSATRTATLRGLSWAVIPLSWWLLPRLRSQRGWPATVYLVGSVSAAGWIVAAVANNDHIGFVLVALILTDWSAQWTHIAAQAEVLQGELSVAVNSLMMFLRFAAMSVGAFVAIVLVGRDKVGWRTNAAINLAIVAGWLLIVYLLTRGRSKARWETT